MLFLAAQSAARWNAPLRLFYERLVGGGKSKKVALASSGVNCRSPSTR
jgi:hypothetical protein